MIDVVFLLLIFFVMTFQITAMEGDFNITATQPDGETAVDPPRELVFRVHLLAGDSGELSGVRFDGRTLGGIEELSAVTRTIVGDHLAHGGLSEHLAVRLRTDASLHYQHVLAAITALRGENPDEPLIEDVRFVSTTS